MKGALILEDGAVFAGESVGADGFAFGEAVFTTSMTGYQEVATDPSFEGQIVCFTAPMVGNYGVDERRSESRRTHATAVVMREARGPEWTDWLHAQGVVALTGVDTRALVRRIRDGGVLRCAVGDASVEELHARALAKPPIDGRPLDRVVGATEPYVLGEGPRVVLVDLGSKRSIPRRVAEAGLECVVLPGDADADEILDRNPRAVIIANGPGDPAVLSDQVETIRELLGRVPLFGICLGHQLLGLALGHETFKLPFGHRGANHPVRDVATGRVLVTVQNHGFAVAANGDTSHVSLNDGTCEGLAGDGFASVQFHPEAAPGPLDALPFFEELSRACQSAPTFARS
jgi:carbamoyl-phosphate synthase small subunit